MTTFGEYRDPGVCQIVTSSTATVDGMWLRVTPPGELDELMNDTAFNEFLAGSGLQGTAIGIDIAVGGVVTAMLADGSVATSKIATDAIDSSKIQASAVTATELADGAVTYAKLDATARPLVTTLADGWMSSSDKTKLDGLTTVSTDMAITMSATTASVQAGSGTPDTIEVVVSGGNAGLMLGADKAQLDTIAASWPVDLTTTVTMSPTDASISVGGGASDSIPLATTTDAGLQSPSDKAKQDLQIYVDSDPTGTVDGSAAANAAVAQAVANGGGTIVFPEGTTLIESPIVLPQDNSGTNRRIIFDLNGTTITTTQNINVFERLITDYNQTDNRNWMITIQNGQITQNGTVRTGSAIYLDHSSNAIIRDLRISNFAQAVSLAFCLHHRIDNVNGVGNEAGLLLTTGERRGWTNLPSASNSNQGLLNQVRFQTATATGRGFDVYAASNITLLNCTVESTTAIDYGYNFDGDKTGSLSLQERRSIEMINCWWEIAGTATVATGAVKIANMRRSSIAVQITSASWPDSLMIACSNNSRSNIIVRPCVGLQDQANKLIPIFDADRKAGSDTNIWYFEQQMISSNVGNLRNPALWVAGEVPIVRERSYDYLTGAVIDSDLTIPANSFLVNADPSGDDLVKSTRVSDLPEGTYTSGNLVFGPNASGDLAHFDVASMQAATSRKDDVEAAVTHSASGILTVDWDAGSYDNKRYRIEANVTELVLVATRVGRYQLWLQSGVATPPFPTIKTGTLESSLWPKVAQLVVNPDSDEWTIYDLYYDGAEWHWG